MGRRSLGAYKMQLIKDIINQPEIIKAIDSQAEGIDPESPDTLIHKNIFDFLRVPGTTLESDTFILLAADKTNINEDNPTYFNIRLTIWVVAHQDRMIVAGQNENRIDRIADLLEDFFQGHNGYGFNMLNEVKNDESILQPNYLYRELIFLTTDQKNPL